LSSVAVPHEYQKFCVEQMTEKPCLALWLECGLGKSLVTLLAIDDLKFRRWAVRRVLVIAPKKVCEATWQDEAAKWKQTEGLRFSEILGTQKQRLAALQKEADIYIVNRENVQWLVDTCGKDWPFDMVVIDEASSFKNHQAKRFKKLKAVRPRIERLYELTGTPAPRNLEDLWAQVYLLDGGRRLGRTISAYRQQWFVPDQRNAQTIFSYKPIPGAKEDIQKRLSDICISMKAEDYLQMEDMVVDDIPVILDEPARKVYNVMEKELLFSVDEQTVDAATAAVLRNKLLQMSAGAVYDDDGDVVHIHDCKLEAFMELLESLDGQNALVFYAFKHDKQRLVEAMQRAKVNYREFSGPDDEKDWNAGKISVLLAHPASCAYGLNLQQGGHHVVWFGLTDSLELYQQANARLHRQGQKEPVIVHRLIVRDSVDEDVARGLLSKDAMQEELLQAMKARIEKVRSEQR
jgi:SNF2 family DNA or RNA helicase